MTKEQIQEANAMLTSVDIKGKDYVMVNKRVQALRTVCPDVSIETGIVSMPEGEVVFKAMIREGDHLLSTGYAWECRSSSYINKTSYIENCETSAVGRALAFLGIGIDASMASAEEVANAMLNQREKKAEPKAEKPKEKIFCERCQDEILPGKKKDGTMATVEEIVAISQKMHGGMIYCCNCQKELAVKKKKGGEQ